MLCLSVWVHGVNKLLLLQCHGMNKRTPRGTATTKLGNYSQCTINLMLGVSGCCFMGLEQPCHMQICSTTYRYVTCLSNNSKAILSHCTLWNNLHSHIELHQVHIKDTHIDHIIITSSFHPLPTLMLSK